MSYHVRLSRKSSAGWCAGTHSYPQPEANFRAANISVWTPEVVEAIAGDDFIGQFTPGNPNVGGRYFKSAFDTEIRGRHITDDPPPEGALFRAACFEEVMSGVTPNKVFAYRLGDPHLYSGSPAGHLDPLPTLRLNYDRREYVGLNVVVDQLEIVWESGKIPIASWSFRGQAAATASYLETASSLSFIAGNRGVATIGEACTLTGYTGTPSIQKITFKLNPEVHDTPDLNAAAGYGIPQTASLDPRLTVELREDKKTNHDPFYQFLQRTAITISWLHNSGGGLGQRSTNTFNGIQAESPQVDIRKGVMYAKMELQQATGAAGFEMAWS